MGRVKMEYYQAYYSGKKIGKPVTWNQMITMRCAFLNVQWVPV